MLCYAALGNAAILKDHRYAIDYKRPVGRVNYKTGRMGFEVRFCLREEGRVELIATEGFPIRDPARLSIGLVDLKPLIADEAFNTLRITSELVRESHYGILNEKFQYYSGACRCH